MVGKRTLMREIGFMQGRLVDQIDDKIQAFPWQQWRLEFPRAQALGLTLVEWTLDDERMDDNPFIAPSGQAQIRALVQETGVRVQSLTGDCFMQAPFWKVAGAEREARLARFDQVLHAANQLGVRYVVVPLVDGGRLESDEQKELLAAELMKRHQFCASSSLQVVFETDYPPAAYKAFIESLPADVFNVNYDTGNSASLGFDPREEFAAYGARVVNVHVKDRKRGGTTVPLGTGDADFEAVFAELARCNYQGDFILQTARASDGHHAAALATYLDMTRYWISRSYGS
jgi:hexulose-6-phosphate isomerase